jgi:hypothetical protein
MNESLLSIIINSIIIPYTIIDTILVFRYWLKDRTIFQGRKFFYLPGLGFRLLKQEMKGMSDHEKN